MRNRRVVQTRGWSSVGNTRTKRQEWPGFDGPSSNQTINIDILWVLSSLLKWLALLVIEVEFVERIWAISELHHLTTCNIKALSLTGRHIKSMLLSLSILVSRVNTYQSIRMCFFFVFFAYFTLSSNQVIVSRFFFVGDFALTDR